MERERHREEAAWITDLLQTQLPTRFPQIRALVWFNWRILEGDWRPWPIESSASSQAAFHDGIASRYYRAGGSFAMPPPLAKVPTP